MYGMNTRQNRDETIKVSSGWLKGIRLAEINVIAWLGVPYASPPVDQLRWKAPREVEPWTGILPVRDFKNGCIQMTQGLPFGSEDCLYLNIWRPEHAESDLPVFVFLHGGGNVNGSGRDFQGGQLAYETNSIVITVNYRLGCMGFFRHPALRTGDPLDDSGNYGLLDIIHALKWVQTNIIAFGGDPKNVTLAGQSAGARNALAAYRSPLSEGLFHKLYAMSGGLTTVTSDQGEAKANEILASLLMKSGVTNNFEESLGWISTHSSASISDYLRGQQAAHFAEIIGDTGLRMDAFPHLFEDGTVIPKEGFEEHKDRHPSCIPVILGSTASEFSGFALADPRFFHLQQGPLSEDEEQKKLYEFAVQYGNELYAAFNVELVAEKLINWIPELPIYAYRFGWGLQDGVIDPVIRFLIGAPHGADIPFYTGDFSNVLHNHPVGVISEHNGPGRKMLSSLMRSYLRRFLNTGDPNGEELPVWQRWTPGSCTNDILYLDANEKQDMVQSIPQLITNHIKSRLDEDDRLTDEQRSWLKMHLFAGRFFWKD